MSGKPIVSDYSDYDYQTEFWGKLNREYEDHCEKKIVQKFLEYSKKNIDTLIDLGAGFGRLFPSYTKFTHDPILVDYTPHLLLSAKKNIGDDAQYICANAYELPFKSSSVDAVVTVRTLHHFVSPDLLFQEISRVLKPEGILIIEIPNKRHILRILKYLLRLSSENPFSEKPLELSPTFINYHPNHIKRLLQSQKLHILCSRNTNFFRSHFFKKIFPKKLLCKTDTLAGYMFSPLNLSPSVFLLCQKTKN